MNRDIHVVLASDRYYFPYIYVAIKSLYEHNKNVDILVVHYIEQDVPKQDLKLLINLSDEYGRKVDIIKFEMPKEIEEVLPAFGIASKTTYAKFWFASMFPNLDRVLYLDPDVLVMDSIVNLYNVEFKNNLAAGVIENLPKYHRDWSFLGDDDIYINGGMVLCNLDAWRSENFEYRALERLKDTEHNLNYDQGILNGLCKGRLLLLPSKYNVLAEVFEFRDAKKIKRRYGFKKYYSQIEIDEAINHPIIIHFTGFLYGKPLSEKCTHPYTKYFQSILDDSAIKYAYAINDISRGQKIRKFFLHNMPFEIYLLLEAYLDIHRKRDL